MNAFYAGEKRQRGGRKKRKKNREGAQQMIVQNWDDIYDPSRPNNYDEYKHSDEKIAEVREWKDRLYAHRMRQRSLSSGGYDSDEAYSRPGMNRAFFFFFFFFFEYAFLHTWIFSDSEFLSTDQFAPPASFAPPSNLNEEHAQSPSPPPLPADASGEDAFTRRLQLSQSQPSQRLPPALQPHAATISRAPVRYSLPPPPEEIPASEAELEEAFAKEQPVGQDDHDPNAPRSLRPGQKGFAQRLLEKYGWTKGSGLGATGSGIANPLQVKVQKPKRRPDSEGGGFAVPAGRGKIVGGKRAADAEDGSKFGLMSEVIILNGMLDGMDLEAELGGDQGVELMQEIGEECSEKVRCQNPFYIWTILFPFLFNASFNY